MADYVTADELRTAAGATNASMPDQLGQRLVRISQAIVESALGRRPAQASGPQEGLKIAEADVAPWQWERLKETVLAVGIHLFENPDVLKGIYFDSVSGPDFSRSGGTRRVFGNEASILFASTGLMPNAARARP